MWRSAEREVGEAPEADPKPHVRRHKLALDLRPTTYARFREARKAFEAERGERLDDDEVMDMLLTRALEGAPAGTMTKPRYQVAMTVCRVCKQGWQNGAGREIAISAADIECATCDAEVISVEKPARPSRTIPAATKRAVLARDHHRCTVPGCRSTQNLDAHHLRHRAHGGTHDMENLTTLCDGHHKAHHRGQLVISGRAPDIDVRWIAEVPRVGEPEVAEQARSVLRNLGFTRPEAAGAVERPCLRRRRGARAADPSGTPRDALASPSRLLVQLVPRARSADEDARVTFVDR